MAAGSIDLTVNGQPVAARAGLTVAAVLAMSGISCFRRSVSGEPRAPLCGMGICFECRVSIDGEPHVRSCQTVIRNGMRIETG